MHRQESGILYQIIKTKNMTFAPCPGCTVKKKEAQGYQPGIFDSKSIKLHLLHHARPAAGVHTSPLVILGHLHGIDTGRAISRALVVLLLILLDLLGVARALIIELLILSSDLLLAVFGVGSTAASTEFMLVISCAEGLGEYSRQLDVDAARRILAVVEGGVVVEFEAGLHAVVVVELNEGEAAALLGGLGLGRDTD
jgi:hypothetical protein